MAYGIISLLTEKDDKSWLSRFVPKFSKDEEAPKEEEKPVEDPEPTIDTSSSVLRRFADRLRNAGSGSSRVALRVSVSDLQDKYLKSGGANAMADALSDEAVLAIAKNPAHPEKASKKTKLVADVEVLPKGYKFSKLIATNDPAHSNTVLLDVPNSLISQLQAAGKSGDINAARDALRKAFSHKHYIMTLHNGPAKKIASKMDTAFADLDETIGALSMNIVGAYPNKKELAEIKDELADFKANQENEPAEKPAETPSDEDNLKDVEGKMAAQAQADSKTAETPSETPAETPPQEDDQAPPIETPAEEPKVDIETTTQALAKAWDAFVQAHGGMSKANPDRLTKEYVKLPAEQRKALQQQLLKMAKAVGFNEDAVR